MGEEETGYTLKTMAYFKIFGEEWEANFYKWHGDQVCEVRETRCNGQEDTHMQGNLVVEDGVWDWEQEETPYTIVTYGSQKVADAILEHIRKHGKPEGLG